jgi:hypothetical protein
VKTTPARNVRSGSGSYPYSMLPLPREFSSARWRLAATVRPAPDKLLCFPVKRRQSVLIEPKGIAPADVGPVCTPRSPIAKVAATDADRAGTPTVEIREGAGHAATAFRARSFCFDSRRFVQFINPAVNRSAMLPLWGTWRALISHVCSSPVTFMTWTAPGNC